MSKAILDRQRPYHYKNKRSVKWLIHKKESDVKNMVEYTYDGTFEGLLTAIYDAYQRREIPQGIQTKCRAEDLLIPKVEIITDEAKADRVYKGIREKISSRALEKIYYTFLSNDEKKEDYIYNYLRVGFKVGGEVENLLTLEPVMAVNKLSQRVQKEKHRMLGLLRFRLVDETKQVYYAPMEPDHHIITLIAPHFAKRLANQNWVIHDVGRGIVAIYDQEDWFLTEAPRVALDYSVKGEEAIEGLWQDYFEHIAIQNKINPSLQRRNMPIRYWKYLTEKP